LDLLSAALVDQACRNAFKVWGTQSM